MVNGENGDHGIEESLKFGNKDGTIESGRFLTAKTPPAGGVGRRGCNTCPLAAWLRGPSLRL